MATHERERRIAERGAVGPVALRMTATERTRGLLGGIKRVEVTEPAYLVDLSVSGAGIIARAIEGLVVRSPVELTHDGRSARGVVRRMVPREDGRVMYGIDFTTMDPEMRVELFSLIASRRPGDLEQIWLHAT